MASLREILLRDLNPHITCSLCGGYLIDATSLAECCHVFCRACILRHFETKLACPTCNTPYKRKTNHPCFKPDATIQSLVYKLVPGLYSREVQRREDFYRSTGVRASSSCSEDSVLGDLSEEHDDWIHGERNLFLSPDDAISLSLEYYQSHLDVPKGSLVKNDPKLTCTDSIATKTKLFERRYLQCPAAVTMSHLQKFLRMKYAVSADHRVDLIYQGEVLPARFSLMDVAYTFKWTRIKPLRFFYRIFTPAKIQPIRIISTCSIGGKHLQVVPVKPAAPAPSSLDASSKETAADNKDTNRTQMQKDKEHLMANLQLQSKPQSPCVYEYEEPDHDEIRAFAEKRDREWALQKQLDEEKERKSKKRKKNKHNKNGPVYKKRKFHAEITSSDSLQRGEESLKLKVKITPHNGYKHKHHKSSSPTSKTPPETEMSAKEKLLQMRQVRHKHAAQQKEEIVNNNDPVKPESPSVKTLRSDFSVKTKEVASRATLPSGSKTEKQTLTKTFQSCPAKKPNGTLDQKLANLYQKPEKKVTFDSAFTVSKVEVGTKKEPANSQEKRPSLEITLIPTPTQTLNKVPKSPVNTQHSINKKPIVPNSPSLPKRPPPPTIPLERIRKSYSLNASAISIIPTKNQEKSDKSGVVPLDLTKTNTDKTVSNGGNLDRNLANLQMLSKVALDEIDMGTKPPVPNLQTLKIPQVATSTQKTIPKLNEIGKGFRLMNSHQPQMRNMRPNQNQSVRSIPNPSLLVRQQNQNRLNSIGGAGNTGDGASKESAGVADAKVPDKSGDGATSSASATVGDGTKNVSDNGPSAK